jgi:DtxR family Mn-dependent transcriptional regulator
MDEQILIQDTLKFLAECEYDRTSVSPETLAGKLSVSQAQVDRLLRDLRSADLIEVDSLALTPSGREYALHVLRAHRLYETYLARKTGVPEAAWHGRADVTEHRLSESDVQELSERLGDPRFDPHGDPIPTAAGDMPAKAGKPLTEYPPGWTGRVVHVEDEPPKLYARIAQAGIAPDTVVRIEETGAHEVRIRVEGCTFDLPREVAGQITAVGLEAGEDFDESIERLSSLRQGEEAAIVGLSPLSRGLERNRLLDLGVVPGTVVTVDLMNPSGSPTAYRIRGASIALRDEQARRVRIRKVRP